MTRRLIAPLLLLSSALALSALFATGAGAATIQISAPGPGRFFAAAPVNVRLKTARSVRSVQVQVDGKGVSHAFRRIGPGRWRAELGAKQVHGGSNRIVASAIGPSGRRDYTSLSFLVGKRRRALLRVERPRLGRAVLVRVHLRARRGLRQVVAKLNGRRVRWPLGLAPARRMILRLGADDGLRYGANHLRVTAVRGDGTYDVEKRTIFVPRTRPLAGAGSDRRTIAGARVRLDGTSSLKAHKRGHLSYRWTVVRKPKGSKARLAAAASPQPLLQTDVPGIYQLRLTVSEPGGGEAASAADVATLTSAANVPPIGEPIQTMVSNGKPGGEADSGIKIGEKTYWLGAPQGKAFQVVILNRSTLGEPFAASYSASEVGAFAAKLKTAGNESLVIVSDPADSPETPELSNVVKSLGIEVQAIESGRTGWSAVGIPGSKEGGFLAAGADPNPGANGPQGALSGYLQRSITRTDQSSYASFAFVPGGRITFETSAPGAAPLHNTIRIGSRTYPSETLSSCATGGFQVLELTAETLGVLEERTFSTAGCGETDNRELTAMSDFLTDAEGVGPVLVVVQSIGRPVAAGSISGWKEAAAAIGEIGGTPAVFDLPWELPFALPGYSLVGQAGIPNMPRVEASETISGKQARVSGLLRQNRVGAYEPVLSSPTASSSFELNAIAYQPSREWPDSQSAGDKEALKYIADEVMRLEEPRAGAACYIPPQPDVRSEYCNLTYRNEWGHKETKLEQAQFEPGHGFGKPEWEAVKRQLTGGELEDVQSVWTLIKELQKVFGLAGGDGQVKLNNIVTRIEASIRPSEYSESTGWYLEFLGNIGSVGSYFNFGLEGEYIQKVLGVFQGAIFESAASLDSKEGNPLLEHFKIRAQEAAEQLSDHYSEASMQLGEIGEILVSDYGKLEALQSSKLLGINEYALDGIATASEKATELWGYEVLMPAVWEAVSLQVGSHNPSPGKASEYLCSTGKYYGGWTYPPFRDAVPNGELRYPTTGQLGVLVEVGSKLPADEQDERQPRLPPETLLKPLAEAGLGIGYFQPWFWHDAYGFLSPRTKSVRC